MVIELPALRGLVLVAKCLLRQAGRYRAGGCSCGGTLAHMAAASLREDLKVWRFRLSCCRHHLTIRLPFQAIADSSEGWF